MRTDCDLPGAGRTPPQPAKSKHSGHLTRRSLLASAALLIMTSGVSARVVTKVLPWQPNEAYPVPPVIPGGYLFFTPAEAAAVDAIVDRLIPTDELGPGAKDAGVTTFIDRQLTGPFGGHDWLYMQGPFSSTPLPTQGLQSPLVPRQQYRLGLGAPLGKNDDAAALAQRAGRLREQRLVLERVVARFLAAVDRQRPQQAQKGPDQRMVEELRLGERAQPARHDGEQDHRVHQRVVVIGGDDQSAAIRDPFRADHLDAPVEHRQQHADHPANRREAHPVRHAMPPPCRDGDTL